MEVITGDALAAKCDYSFGDQAHAFQPHVAVTGSFKEANATNHDFLKKAKEFEGKIMTLFIDNIRLYNRSVAVTTEDDKRWVEALMATNDLLRLCSLLPYNGFTIFTSHEDTPIDEQIILPQNVERVYAVNAKFNNDRIVPFPYGLQRQMGQDDHRIDLMRGRIKQGTNPPPLRLLYINCGLGKERNAPERAYLPNFEGLDWTTCRFDKDSKYFPYERYSDYLNELQNHKFVICPEGHGIDCHRNWESLYMRRVPVMKESTYFRRLMSGLPVLFVGDWSEITVDLLRRNDHLFQEAQTMDLQKLDLNKVYEDCISGR